MESGSKVHAHQRRNSLTNGPPRCETARRGHLGPQSAQRSHSPAGGRENASPAVMCNALLGGRMLFKDLIRALQYRLRDRKAERLSGLEVDDQVVLGGLLDWQVGRFGALEDLVD